jgi:hypothetical protein
MAASSARPEIAAGDCPNAQTELSCGQFLTQAEAAYHKSIELARINWLDEEVTSDDYLAYFSAEFHDIRDAQEFRGGGKSRAGDLSDLMSRCDCRAGHWISQFAQGLSSQA